MRNEKINFLQNFGILLVVLGHAIPIENNIIVGMPIVHKFIYSFHMPLFMFISGYLLNYTTKDISNINLIAFIVKKAKRLLLPYFIISSFVYIPKCLFSSFAMRKSYLSVEGWIHSLVYPGDNPIIFFWFLPTLFFIMISVVVLLKIIKNNINILFLISLIASLISFKVDIDFLNINGILYYSFFFCLGIFYIKYEKIFNICKEKYYKFIIIVSIILLVINCYIEMIDEAKILVAIIGIIFSIIIGFIYEKHQCMFLSFINSKTYSIYLLSWFPQVFIRIVSYQILELGWVFTTLISFIFGTSVPILINRIIYKMVMNYNKKFIFLANIFGVSIKR